MTVQTRYALVGASGVLALGLAGGLVAYLQGGLPIASAQTRPDAFRYVPAAANVVAFANVRDVMYSDFRQQMREFVPDGAGQAEFQERTGINLEDDIDTVVACLVPRGSEDPQGLVVLNGRFDVARLEALAREHGGTVSEYQGRRMLTTTQGDDTLAMAFVEPGVVALGSDALVREAIDLPSTGNDVTSNTRLMGLLSNIDAGSNAWAIGRLDGPGATDWLPDEVETQIPQVAAFAVGGRVNGGLSGTVMAEARDEAAGQNLRDIIQGFLALARMQTSSRPELASLLDSFQLSAVGTNVSLSFALPTEFIVQLLSGLANAAGADAETPQ